MYKTLLVALAALMMAAAASAHDPFNDPAYPGVPGTPEQDKESTEAPGLPDFTVEPYTPIREVPRVVVEEFPQLGELTLTMYVTAPKPVPGANAVYVFRDANGKPVYAEWHAISEDGTTYTRRQFHFRDGRWKFFRITVRDIIIEG